MTRAIVIGNRWLAVIALIGLLTLSAVGANVYVTFYGRTPEQKRIDDLEGKVKRFENLILDPALKRYVQEGKPQ